MDILLIPPRVIRPPDEVVERHIKVIRESDKDGHGWLLNAAFITLIVLFKRIYSFCGLFLGDFSGNSNCTKTVFKFHNKLLKSY